MKIWSDKVHPPTYIRHRIVLNREDFQSAIHVLQQAGVNAERIHMITFHTDKGQWIFEVLVENDNAVFPGTS